MACRYCGSDIDACHTSTEASICRRMELRRAGALHRARQQPVQRSEFHQELAAIIRDVAPAAPEGEVYRAVARILVAVGSRWGLLEE